MLEDLADDEAVVDRSDELAGRVAARADEHVDCEDALQELRSRSGAVGECAATVRSR